MFEGKREIENVLRALSEQLDVEGVSALEMVVCGGAALSMLGYVRRATKDIDVIAFVDRDKDGLTILAKATPLRPALVAAAKRVQKDFNLPENWLNDGPASVIDLGLPEGLVDRAEVHSYGKSLVVDFLSRYDQIHFKLYAAVDRDRRDVHYDDLVALNPSPEELEEAARWTLTHDPSEGYREVLKDFLAKIGRKDVGEKL